MRMEETTRSGVVGYADIAARLSAEIRAGKYAARRSFPSLTKIMRRFGVTRVTAMRSVDDEAFFKRKMRAFYQKIGARRMHELGHGTKEQFASAQAKLVYATWRGRIHPRHYPRYLPCKVFSLSPLDAIHTCPRLIDYFRSSSLAANWTSPVRSSMHGGIARFRS